MSLSTVSMLDFGTVPTVWYFFVCHIIDALNNIWIFILHIVVEII